MGKKSWFSAVKKLAVSPSFSKVKKDKRYHKSKSSPKKAWHENQMSLDIFSSQTEATLANPPSYPSKEDIELKQPQNEQIKFVDTIFYATPMVVDVEETVSHAKVNCVTSSPRFLGKSKEEIDAIRIQTAYRGNLVIIFSTRPLVFSCDLFRGDKMGVLRNESNR
ncbi:IQ-domain containing protein [Artemisia annua]|uniref:IQ-domain containing protein n=1 Tax=Artemisia annua TaxID=35608 RepID=A0A2U1L2I2_ARTAN|nr:IQ-domain containing protein [Artemisia annua]